MAVPLWLPERKVIVSQSFISEVALSWLHMDIATFLAVEKYCVEILIRTLLFTWQHEILFGFVPKCLMIITLLLSIKSYNNNEI